MPNDVIDIDIPKWDPALASLVKEEFNVRKKPLQLEDFLELAQQHAIRFDDIMVTMFELCINGVWEYSNRDGTVVPITQEKFERLYKNGRLHEADLRDYNGHWALVQN